MRIRFAIACLALPVALLVGCGPQQPTVAVDPNLGHDCYAKLLPSLPNGTQYEGVESATQEKLTIRVMTGVDVTTADCALNPDGTLQAPGE